MKFKIQSSRISMFYEKIMSKTYIINLNNCLNINFCNNTCMKYSKKLFLQNYKKNIRDFVVFCQFIGIYEKYIKYGS